MHVYNSNSEIFVLKTAAGSHRVENRVKPVGGFNTIEGFFVIAHRGASYDLPENSMPSFKKAHHMKADMIELDVLLSRDGIPVVIHDEKLHRTTNGKGIVSNYFYRELQELDAGSWFGREFRGTTIPSLQTVLRWASDRIALNIEIKGVKHGSKSTTQIEPVIIELIRQYGMERHVVVSSFSRGAIRRVKKVSDQVATAILNSDYSYGTRRVYRMVERLGADGLNMLHRQMKRPLMNELHAHAVPVWIYTVNFETEMRAVIRKGASGIFTDRPDLLRKVAEEEFLAVKNQD